MDIKIKKLLRTHDYEGYGVYWFVIETLYSHGGQMQSSELLEELDLIGHGDYLKTLSCLGLLDIDEETGVVSNKRVLESVGESEARRKKFSDMGRTSAERRLNTSSTNVERTLNAGSTDKIRREEIRGDKNITYSELLSTNVPNNSSYVSSELSFDSVQASTPDPIFITILTNSNTEFPIRESSISLWEDTFKAVNVREELKKMKSWSVSNPKLRKTERGMMRFVNNWLSGEQDKAGRQSYRSQPEVIKGTNIKMPVTADGSDRDKYRQDPNEVLRKYGLLPEGGQK